MYYKKTLKPYMINAFYTWAMDLGYTPYLEIKPSEDNIYPSHITHKENIIFNIHPKATVNLILGKQHIEFETKFNGKPEQITLNYESIARCYTKEDNYSVIFEDQFPTIENAIKKPKLKIIKKNKIEIE